jgi:polyisoprenoid-binding protein YceI
VGAILPAVLLCWPDTFSCVDNVKWLGHKVSLISDPGELSMRKFHLGIAAIGGAGLLAVAAANAQGAPELPGQPDPSRVTAGDYTIDGGHTQIVFSYSHFGLTDNLGVLSGASGSLSFDPASPNDAKLSVDVPVNTIHTTIAALDKEFVGPNYFDVEQFPTAHFESTSVVADGTSATITGNLTIKGVTKPAVIDAEFFAAGPNPFSKKETVGFTGKAVIKRSEFGLGTFAPMVSDEVELSIMAAFEKAPEAE